MRELGRDLLPGRARGAAAGQALSKVQHELTSAAATAQRREAEAERVVTRLRDELADATGTWDKVRVEARQAESAFAAADERMAKLYGER